MGCRSTHLTCLSLCSWTCATLPLHVTHHLYVTVGFCERFLNKSFMSLFP
uniref:Fatty acid desaturase domain-containing protein n=1 Tax=Anguilla anguilla TaxID=7936 RepID=A0A0E9W6E1_ANGAN